MSTNRLDSELQKLEEKPESWQPDGNLKKCWLLEDRLKVGLQYFGRIREVDESWSRAVQSGDVGYSERLAREIRRAYDWFFQPCERILAEINQVEQFYPVDGAAEFRKAMQFVYSIRRVPIDELIRSTQQAIAGEARPLDEVMNELCGETDD